MGARYTRGVLVPNQGYVCLSCRLQSGRGGARRYQHASPAHSNGASFGSGASSKAVEDNGKPVSQRTLRDIIGAFINKSDTSQGKESGNDDGNTKGPRAEPQGENNQSPAASKSPRSSADPTQQKLQQKFATQRREQMLAMQADQASKALEQAHTPKAHTSQDVAAPRPANPKIRGKRKGERRHPKETEERALAVAARKAAKAESLNMKKQNQGIAQGERSDDVQEETAKEVALSQVERSLAEPFAEEPVKKTTEEDIEKQNTSKSAPAAKGGGKGLKKVQKASQKKAKSKAKAQDDDGKKSLTEAERKAKLAEKLEPMLRKAQGKGFRLPVQKYPTTGKLLTTKLSSDESIESPKSLRITKVNSRAGVVPRLVKVDKPSKPRRLTGRISDVSSFDSLQTALKGRVKRPNADIEKADATKLEILPIDIDQAPVPRLSYGLERVLFNPGVYQLQDPRSRVYNFDPYLQKIMPVAEFDFNALKEYITSSKDESLKRIAKAHGKRYVGSTSSMTAILAHFHFLLSQWRPINISMLSKSFPAYLSSFTQLQRTPSAIFLRWKDGSYAIDADKQFDSANVLSMLGKSMEKLLTLNTEDYEKYRKSSPGQVTSEEQLAPETFHYSTMGDFLMRSQLDAHDSRLPGTGMFDLKTRAVVSIRMDVSHYEQGLGYQIKSRQGEWESYEREYYDMIRAAFLKYSMQVRMGRMDGIFVAFHNVERIFGFQYISLPEMDSTIHGQWDTSIGDQEFKLSLDLLNKVLDKATQRFPETSIRLHFETRDASTPFMYIFAVPVTEEQVAEIQSQNEAQIEAFNRNILGLTQGDESESQDSEEDDSKWDDIQADVQEAMDNDELSVAVPSEEQEADDEDIQDSALAANEEGVLEQGPPYANKNDPPDADYTPPAVTGSEDDEAEAEDDDDGLAEGEDDDEVEEAEEEQVDDVNQEANKDEGNDKNIDEAEEGEDNEVIEETTGERNDAEESDGEHSTDISGDERETFDDRSLSAMTDDALESEDDAESQLEEDQSDPVADEKPEVETAQEAPEPEPTQFSGDAPPQAQGEKEYVPPLQGAEGSEMPTEADQPFLDSITEELASVDDPTSSAQDILAMTLTVRNKVNGKFVLRPEHLTAKDSWSIEYSLDEVSSQRRARALYEACQTRRKKRLDAPEVPEEEEVLNQYLLRLRELSAKGRKWRDRMDREDMKKPRQVLGQEVAQSDVTRQDDLTNEEPEA